MDQTRPIVSVLVPVFNGESYLRESLDSIIAQTFLRLEVLVLDDASTDRTPAVVASYGERVKYYRQPYNKGIYGNMNDGIAMARGDYIAIYHSDDIYDPRIVEREVEFLECYSETGAVFCKDVFIDRSGREVGRLELPPEVRGSQPLDYPVVFNALLKYKNRLLRCPSCMARAAVYRDIGQYRDREFKNSSDLEMYLRIAQRYPIGILDEYLFRYRWGHGNSGQRYRYLRTEPEHYFAIMDHYLRNGGQALVTQETLEAYEAHRNEDRLMRVISYYILDRCKEARTLLSQIQVRQILASPRVQRSRLLTLLLLLQVLVRLPRISLLADRFYGRWHAAGE